MQFLKKISLLSPDVPILNCQNCDNSKRRYSYFLHLLIALIATTLIGSKTGAQSIIYKANEFHFRQFSINQGLSHSSVTTMIQDNDGFLWIGTYDGLNKFDGLNFTVFKRNPDNENSLVNDRIHTLFLDDTGEKLWIGTEEGISILDLRTYQFETLNLPKQINAFKPDVRKITKSDQGEIWVLTANSSLHRFTSQAKHIMSINILNMNTSVTTLSLEDVVSISEHEYLFCTTNGLYVYHIEKNEFSPIFPEGIVSAYSVFKKDKHYFVGTTNGLKELFFDKDGFVIKQSLLEGNTIFHVTMDFRGDLWVATNGNGLFFGRNNEGHIQFYNYSHDHQNNHSISSDRIKHIYGDNAGNTWISTIEQGINQIDNKTKNFISIQNMSHSLIPTSSNYITCLSEASDSTIFVGFRSGGLCLFNPARQEFMPLFFHSTPIQSSSVTNVMKDSRGTLWILTWDGVFVLQQGRNIPERVFITSQINPQPPSYCIEEDEYGRIWVGTRTGLIYFDDHGGNKPTISRITSEEDRDPHQLDQISIQSLYYDESNSELWVGTQHAGLFIIPVENGGLGYNTDNIRHYSFNNADKFGLKSNYISSIFKKRDVDIYYIGTEGGGLCRVTRSNDHKEFFVFREEHGLTNNVVKSILEDDYDNLWIGTNNGLFQFDTGTSQFTSYDYSDGIQSNAFNYPSLKSNNGFLFFGGINGFTYFHPDHIKKNTMPPNIVFNDFYLFYRKVNPGEKYGKDIILPYSLSVLDTLELRYNQNSFSIEIIPVHFGKSSRNKIKYMLKPYDNDWIYINAHSNIASYSKIRPGKYVFMAMGANSDDVWTTEARELHIIINPPFWITRVAFLFYFCIMLISIYLTYRIVSRINRLRNELRIEHIEKEKENELHQAKLRFFTNISHEFKTPISLILGPASWLSQKLSHDHEMSKKLSLITTQASCLLRLIEQLLEFRKTEKDTLQLKCEERDIVSFISQVKDSFEQLAYEKNITLELESPYDSIDVWFDADKLEKIMNNLLSNAFKYTNDNGIISILIKSVVNEDNKECVVIQVSDTGSGIAKKSLPLLFNRFYQVSENDGGYGIGLSLSKTLVELHKGRIWAESEEGKGASFFVELLKHDFHLCPDEKLEPNDKSQELPVNDLLMDRFDIDEIYEGLSNVESNSKDTFNGTILIVEDHNDLRMFLQELIQDYYNVVTAENGIEALKLLEKEHPKAIISDVMMPGMDGIELCRNIKSNINTCHIPVILLTSKASVEHQIQGLEIGADSYITKPFHIKQLIAQLNNLMQSRHLLYERFKNGVPMDINAHVGTIDSKFFYNMIEVIEKYLDDPEFDSDQFSREMFLNRTDFYRKMKAITNFTPGEFLRNYRLTKAAELLVKERLNVSEVIHYVGFRNRSHFTRCFKEKFGVNPTDYKAFLSKGELSQINISLNN